MGWMTEELWLESGSGHHNYIFATPHLPNWLWANLVSCVMVPWSLSSGIISLWAPFTSSTEMKTNEGSCTKQTAHVLP